MRTRIYLLAGLIIALTVLDGQVALAQSDIRFGAVEAYDAPNAATQAGVGWERVRFQWAVIQADGPQSWDDGELTDAIIAQELAAGRQVVGLLIGLPDWANENGVPRGLYLAHTDPNNTWATFVRTMVTRYAGRIDHWILWNEPDVWDTNHPGHTWNGSVQDFLQLNRVGYVTAKESNPQSVIHLAAVTHWWDAQYGRELYFQRYLEALVADHTAAGNQYYFDVATLHLYFQPDTVYDLTSYYYGLMGAYGIWKPIWIVETNAAPSMDPAWPVAQPRFHVSLEEQAAYMPQALAMGMAAGAQRIGVYKMIDTPGDAAANPEPFGLVRANGSYRPAFSTFQVAVRLLGGATRASRERWDDVGQVTVEQAGQTTTVLFSRVPGPRSIEIAATDPTASLVDMWGNKRTIQAKNGAFKIELEAAPCSQSAGDYCIIGGPTYYLVQGSGAGSTSDNGPAMPSATPAPPREATVVNSPVPTPTQKPTESTPVPPTPSPSPTALISSPTLSPTKVHTLAPTRKSTTPLPTVEVLTATPTVATATPTIQKALAKASSAVQTATPDHTPVAAMTTPAGADWVEARQTAKPIFFLAAVFALILFGLGIWRLRTHE